MGIFDALKRQLRSVIQWENPDPNSLFHLWSDNGDELKNASKLIVGPGQGCIFVYEGEVQTIHLNEGTYELKTANIPFWTTLSKFMQAFESEHKVGIYFFWQTQFLNQKWGTVAPIKYNDPVYKFPVGLRAFGNFSFQITEPGNFFVNVIGGKPEFTVDAARQVISQRFLQQLADTLATAAFGYSEIDRNRVELAEMLTSKVAPEFGALGFKMTDFRIENTDFDADTVARIGKIADTMAEAEAAKAAGLNYAQMQQLGALRDAAKNEGGAAGAGIGLGAGVGLGQAMAGAMASGFGGATGGAAGASSGGDVASRLKKLDELKAANLITPEEFEKKRAEILSSI